MCLHHDDLMTLWRWLFCRVASCSTDRRSTAPCLSLSPLQIDEKVSQYAKYIFEPVGVNWGVTYEDGEMKVREGGGDEWEGVDRGCKAVGYFK